MESCRRDGDKSWLVRIFRPQGEGPFPTLLDVHGGAWANGDRLMNETSDVSLAESGDLPRAASVARQALAVAGGDETVAARIRAALAEYESGRAVRMQAEDWGRDRLGP